MQDRLVKSRRAVEGGEGIEHTVGERNRMVGYWRAEARVTGEKVGRYKSGKPQTGDRPWANLKSETGGQEPEELCFMRTPHACPVK